MKNWKQTKRIISLLLCLLMLTSLVPLSAMAEEESQERAKSHYDHVDVRVDGSLTLKTTTNGQETSTETIKITTSNVTGTLTTTNNNKTTTQTLKFYSKAGSGKENEWRCNKLSLDPTKDTVSITCTLKGTRSDKSTIEKTVTLTYTGEQTLKKFIQNCPGKSGYDIDIDAEDLTQFFTVDKTVTKIWNDDNNRDNLRPSSIKVQLYADGNTYGDPVTLNAANNWQVTFKDLPDTANYTVKEVGVPTGYTNSVDNSTLTITNTHTPETTTISGSKTWADNNNQDGLRPNSITVNLLANGSVVRTKTVTAEDGWAYSFADLPVYESGNKITYTIAEEAVEGYTATVNGYNITNTHTPTTVTISGSKTWADNGNQDGKRPTSITVKLLENGSVTQTKTVTAADGWKWSFEDLPEYKNGEKITYTIEEGAVEGYTATVDGYNITNTHTPTTVTISGSKTWNDDNNRDGIRPASITVKLLANGTEVASQTATEANDWSWKFENMPEYKDGKKITYTVAEEAVKGYTATVNGYNITNTHTPETVTVSGAKTWNDDNDRDGKRPDSITVSLLANGKKVATKTVTAEDGWKWSFAGQPKKENGKEITYTVAEDAVEGYTATVNGYNITNTYAPAKTSVSVAKIWQDDGNQDGVRPESITVRLYANGKELKAQTITAKDGWSYTFDDLYENENGKTIVYTVTEDAVSGYTSQVAGTAEQGFTLTNTHASEMLTISGTKTWDDNNDQDDIRPNYIVLTILADGEKYGEVKVFASNEWKWSMENLPAYKNGKKITYTISESEVKGYEAVIDGFDLTNVHTPATITISGGKTWNDDNDRDGIRPEKITVNVLNDDGTVVATKTVTAEDGWNYSFDNLPKFNGGKEITYTVTEEAVEGYSVESDGFDLINTHEIETVKLTVTKTWDDDDDRDGIRPNDITVKIMNGETEVVTAKLTAANNWTWTSEALPKNENGKQIEYTVIETAVEGYEASYDGLTITNTHAIETVTVSGSKTWNDDNDRDGIRPESITVNLLADGEKVATKTVTAEDGWAWTFENLPKNENGEEITYTVTEEAVEGYSVESDGFDLINTHEIETVKLTVTKTWDDKEDQDGLRPEKVTVYVLANGKKTGTVLTLSAENKWTAAVEDLPAFDGGEKIVYTLEEEAVEGYTAKVTGSVEEGFTLTNTHTPEEPTVPETTVPETTVPETTVPETTAPVKNTETPKTGDNSNLFVWTAVLLASVLGMTALVVTKKNRV